MSWFKSKSEMVAPDQAMRGRGEEMVIPGRHLVLGTPLLPPASDGFARAMFAMGCFWGAERKFWVANGVYTTAVGYSGGYTPSGRTTTRPRACVKETTPVLSTAPLSTRRLPPSR